MKTINLCVIGGGLSGLVTANQLLNKIGDRIQITIIEKEQQFGGRIYSKTFKDCTIELGAQFFVDNGVVHNLIKSLDLEKEIILLSENFISFFYDNKIYSRKELSQIDIFQGKGVQEKNKLLEYARTADARHELVSSRFDQWYTKIIGGDLLPFWNRVLISIGVRDVKSINAYFALILINVFFGKNYLLKSGLQQLINKLEEKVLLSNGEILKNTKCLKIEKKNEIFHVQVENRGSIKELIFDQIISAIQPQELLQICQLDGLQPLQYLDGYPMTLYVIDVNKKIWDDTWGLIVCKQDSPILALCDWKNVSSVNQKTPILAICSPDAQPNDVITEMKRLFPKEKLRCKIIFEKKWSVGLHQPNEKFFMIHQKMSSQLPSGFYLAGDWMILPALEGAAISGIKAVKEFINKSG